MLSSFSRVLVRVADAVGSASSQHDIYEAALVGLAEATGVERASILLFDSDGVMRFKAWRGLSAAYRTAVEGYTPWRPDSPVPSPIVVPDVLADESFERY